MKVAFLLSLAGVLMLLSHTAGSQTAREGAGANAQFMQQMQQLASERVQLQAENAGLKKELEELKKRYKSLETEKESLTRNAQSSRAALSRSTANAEGLEQNLTQQRARMEELVAKFRETATTLRDVETDRVQLKDRLAAREREIHTCVERNLALYKVNSEVLDHFGKQGFWSSLGRAEPFTQLKRVANENLIEEYRSRADDQRADAPSAPPSPGG
jgi:chromosome segregation ATPase